MEHSPESTPSCQRDLYIIHTTDTAESHEETVCLAPKNEHKPDIISREVSSLSDFTEEIMLVFSVAKKHFKCEECMLKCEWEILSFFQVVSYISRVNMLFD